MPTPNDFRQVLRQLANHLHHLHQELLDTGLPAARQSQTGARTTTVKGRPPCDLTMLDHLHTDVMPRIAGWAYNLSADTGITIPTQVITGGHWCAWLNRYADTLTTMPWAQDCYDELTDLQAELRHHINPPQPARVKLPDYATADEIAKAYGITPRAVRKYCNTHHITAWKIDGATQYNTREYRELKEKPITVR